MRKLGILTVTEMMCVFYKFVIFWGEIKTIFFDIQYSVNESRATVGLDGSAPEFHSGRTGHFSCGSG